LDSGDTSIGPGLRGLSKFIMIVGDINFGYAAKTKDAVRMFMIAQNGYWIFVF
jgi:hypothetical protein